MEWFEGFTKFIHNESNNVSINSRDWHPQYLPVDFIESEYIVMGEITQIIYSAEQGNEINLTIIQSNDSLSVDNDGVNYRQIQVDGIDYYLFEATDGKSDNTIVWLNKGYTFELFSILLANDVGFFTSSNVITVYV